MFPSNMEFKFIKPKHAKAKNHDSLSAMTSNNIPIRNILKKKTNILFGKPICIDML